MVVFCPVSLKKGAEVKIPVRYPVLRDSAGGRITAKKIAKSNDIVLQ